MFRHALLAALLAFASPALAVNLPPCNDDTAGTVLIVPRPPTADELAALVADRPLGAPLLPPPLLMQHDHITCIDGAWSLTRTVPQYRGQ